MKLYIIRIGILLLLLSAASVKAQGLGQIPLRDGTKLDGKIIQKGEAGITVKIENDIVMSIPWTYLAPEYSYKLYKDQWKKKIKGMPSVKQLLSLAAWCQKQGLYEKAKAIYQDIIDNHDPDNKTAREALDFHKFKGKWWKKEELEKELERLRKLGKKNNGNNPSEPQPADDNQKPKKKIKLVVKIACTFELKPRSPKEEYSKSLEDVVKEKLEKAGFKIVRAGADYTVSGSALINQTKAVTFMRTVGFVSFKGELTVNLKSLHDKNFNEELTTTAMKGKNDMKKAVDELFDELASKLTSQIIAENLK